MRIPAATAAFNDSTSEVGMRISWAAACKRALTPRPSLPIMKAQRRRRLASIREVSASGIAAYRSTLRCSRAAIANSASSLIQSKNTGNLIFIQLSPLSYREIFFAYVAASVMRGLAVGLGVYLVTLTFFDVPLSSFPWVLMFALMGSALLGAIGVIAGIWAEKFDQLAAFQNFVILPLTFLSGVFYTIPSLPPFWQGLSHLNPFFYMIDGFRYGFFRASDISPYVSLGIVATCFVAVSWLTLQMLKRGYKIRH